MNVLLANPNQSDGHIEQRRLCRQQYRIHEGVMCSMFCSCLSGSLLVQAHVMAVLSSNGFVDSSAGCEGPVGLVLDATSFYAEQGGQVADIGSVTSSSGHNFDVQDTQVMPRVSVLFLIS